MRTRAPFLVALGLALGGVLHAGESGWAFFGGLQTEIRGTVTETDGRPVLAARVELRADGTIFSAATTDPQGRFTVRVRSEISGALSLHVERMGYQGAILEVRLDGEPVSVVLRPEPLPLPGLRVEVQSPICDWADEAPARAVWEAMAERHPAGLDTLGIASYTLARTDTLPENGVQSPVNGGLIPGQRSSAPLLRMSWDRRAARTGYAFPVRRTDRAGSFDSWSYAPLEADFAPHFASPTFGRLHRFKLTGGDAEGGWLLRFCPVHPDRPSIEGQLEIGPDTLLLRAEWRFRTPEPDEDAGGWARFASPPPDERPAYLLPLESLIWRNVPREQGTLRRAQWYESWVLAPGDSVPFLPSRDGDQRGAPGASGEPRN